jgi:hypothetical protein
MSNTSRKEAECGIYFSGAGEEQCIGAGKYFEVSEIRTIKVYEVQCLL